MYSSETLALIKDTDKEDREKALKAQWEADEPGRADKAKLSRQKFMLKKKVKAEEQLTEEELEILNEKRERVRKKDQDEAAAKGAKGGKAPPAKGKGAPPPKGAPAAAATEEVHADSGPKITYPLAENHVNNDIMEFLDHFASSRKIIEETADDQETRKRSDEEKEQILEDFNSEQTAESESFQQIGNEREQMKETRQAEREEAFKDMDEQRGGYKGDMNKLIYEERNQYRDMIDSRNEKQGALVELLRQDKADVNGIKTAIEAAEAVLVKPKYIKKAKKFLVFMEYIKEFEGQLQGAVADKNKEALQALLERVEQETGQLGYAIPIDPKILNDAKGNLAKMK